MAELTEKNFYFTNFPTVDYDIKKNGKSIKVPNLTVRYKIMEVLKNQRSAYFDYTIHDGVRADMIADQYYGDSSLDWIVYLTNNITIINGAQPNAISPNVKILAKRIYIA